MVICDFSDPSSELSEKEIKRQTLQELLEYVGMTRGVLTAEAPYPEIVKMVSLYIRIKYHSLTNIIVCYQSIPYHTTSSESYWRRL